jgi:hypothetical protein
MALQGLDRTKKRRRRHRTAQHVQLRNRPERQAAWHLDYKDALGFFETLGGHVKPAPTFTTGDAFRAL